MLFDKKNERLDMMQQLSFTSKASLKRQCLFVAGGNIREAKELYDFLIDDMQGLPDTDPVPASWQENTRDTVNGVFKWVKENRDTLSEGVGFLRSLFQGVPSVTPPAAPLDEINP